MGSTGDGSRGRREAPAGVLLQSCMRLGDWEQREKYRWTSSLFACRSEAWSLSSERQKGSGSG